MAVAVNKTRKLIATDTCPNTDLVSYEYYAYFEDTPNNGKKLYIEVKAVCSEKITISGASIEVDVSSDSSYRMAYIYSSKYSQIYDNAVSFNLYQNVSVYAKISDASAYVSGAYRDVESRGVRFSIFLAPEIGLLFDGERISEDAITAFHQDATLFADTFKLGSTVCRNVTMSVLKSYVSQIPENVVIKDKDGVTRFTLLVDSVDDTDIDFYNFTFVDKMILLNRYYDYSNLETKDAQHILGAICTNVLGCTAPVMTYGGTIPLNYSEDVTARDIVSWCAEINGSFARIDETGNLLFVAFASQTPSATVNVNTCKDFVLGEYHKIDRVYVELGTDSYAYPNGTENPPIPQQYNTVYLNGNNQLITDSGGYTITGIVQHIYSVINGFDFYSISSKRCEINQNSLAGDRIVFSLNGETYPTIAQIDWEYNGEWYGGYSCEVETKQQEETNVIETVGKTINSLKITVDRQNGMIEQKINASSKSLEDNLKSIITQTAGNITESVSKTTGDLNERLTTLETKVSISLDGVKISQGEEDKNYVRITDNGLEIVVNGVPTAWVTADGFFSNELVIGDPDGQKWHLHETNNHNTLMILRR